MAEAHLQILKSVTSPIEDYLEVQFHVGTAAVAANLAMLGNTEMTGGQRQFVQLRLASPLPLVPGERFVVRANLAGRGGTGLTTIGGGQIIGLSNARLRRKKSWTLDRLAARRAVVNNPLRWCERMVRESESPATLASLQKVCWSRPEEIVAQLQQLQAEKRLVAMGGGDASSPSSIATRASPPRWVHAEVVAEQGQQILVALEAFHAANAQRAGLGRDELLTMLKFAPESFDASLAGLILSRQVERKDALFARAGWNSRLPERDQKLCEQMATRFQQAGFAPPGLEELAAVLSESTARISILVKLLAEHGIVVKLDEKVWMHRDAVDAGKRKALELFQKRPLFSTMDFRDALGVSRKFAVPLVDYFDRIRFTVRNGNNRTPGAEAKKLFNG